MTKRIDLGLTSTSKASTQQQDRERIIRLRNELHELREDNKKLINEVLGLLRGT